MNDLRKRLEAELSVLPFIQTGFTLTPLNAGTVNSSYRLESADKCYFVKTFESDQIAKLDRQGLFDIQSALLSEQLSVKPIYLSTTNHFQIDQWLESKTLDQIDLSRHSVCQTLARTLVRIHASKVTAPTLDLPAQWQHYIELLGNQINAEDLRKLETYAQTWFRACSINSVFCHNDLALSHITYGEPSHIFDWEYCALSCPYFDLASCIAVNGLGQADEASLCAFYAQYSQYALSEVLSGVNAMKPLVELTYRLWYQSAKLAV